MKNRLPIVVDVNTKNDGRKALSFIAKLYTIIAWVGLIGFIAVGLYPLISAEAHQYTENTWLMLIGIVLGGLFWLVNKAIGEVIKLFINIEVNSFKILHCLKGFNGGKANRYSAEKEEVKKCIHCNAEILEEYTICPNCGGAIE